MTTLLELLAWPARRAPRRVLLLLTAVTLVLGGTATQLQVSSDLSQFAPEGGLGERLDDVRERFGAGEAIQLIIDTGPGGDLLGPTGLAAGERLASALREDPELAGWLAEDRLDRPAVLTYAEPFAVAAEVLGTSLAELDERTADALVDGLLADAAGAQAVALLSDDLERDPPRARGGIGLVELRSDLDDDALAEATAVVQRISAESATPGVRISVLSQAVIETAVQDGIARDVPVLLSLSLLLVVLVLAWLFRSVADVVVGLAGLLASIVWMAGLAALLGPGMLDVVGPFGQPAIAVPVLLVGLGVDYSVHLTTRYREQRARGDRPEVAATTALHTVGVALVLATIATVGGFLANLATPLPPIADLGVFAALGIVSAFVIFGLAVPATRVALDRRVAAEDDEVDVVPPASRPARWVVVLTGLAVRRGPVVLAVTAGLLAVGGLSAAGLGTEFDERSFLPDGAAATTIITRTDELFGGDVGEQTFVVVDGDTDDAPLLAGARQLQEDLADVEEVRTIGGRAQVTSPFELIDRLGDRGLRVRDGLASDLDAWADPAAAADDLPVPDQLPPETLEEEAASVDLPVPDEVLRAIARRLPDGRGPEVALATSTDPARIREAIRDRFREDVIADRPAGLDDRTLAGLAALPASELGTERLAEAGFPLETLDDADRAALRRLERLEDAGWDAQDPTRSPGDVAERFAVTADEVPEELGATVDDEGLLLAVSTAAGQSGAGALAAEITDLAETHLPDADVTVVSSDLVTEEIIDSLSAAQLLAIIISIAIAAVLLVAATVVSDRSVVLGLIGTAPAVVALVLVLGTMPLIGLSFNALTATVASIAIGIGVPYGIHLTNRFRVSLVTEPDVPAAVADTLRHTGGALVGSAVTTGLAFGVLGFSSSVPLRQFGTVATLMIAYALLACLLLQPALLTMWARHRG
ncbi:MAG: MMPL family transporter [Nitriliruptor sp.]